MAYFERGDCYQLVGQDMMAFRDFEKCLSLRENHVESRLRFSQVSFRIANDLMAKKKYRAALDYYTISIQYKRDIMLPFFMRAQCYLLLGVCGLNVVKTFQHDPFLCLECPRCYGRYHGMLEIRAWEYKLPAFPFGQYLQGRSEHSTKDCRCI